MMLQLEAESFPLVLSLYRAMEINFPLIQTVIVKQQRGQVFVDNRENPTSAVVITNFGFMSFLGNGRNKAFHTELAELLRTRSEISPTYLLWYSPPSCWRKRLDPLVPDLVRVRERIRFEFSEERATFLTAEIQCPADLELRNLDSTLIPKTAKLGVYIDSRFWSSSDDFLENGFGLCLVRDNEVVSLCYATCVVTGLAEIDVVTHPEHRGQGLGSLVAKKFIRECVRRGVKPTWDCFSSNVPSLRLAENLGFVRARTYPFYSFEVPLNVPEVSRENNE